MSCSPLEQRLSSCLQNGASTTGGAAQSEGSFEEALLKPTVAHVAFMIWLSQQGHAGVPGLGEPEAEQKALLLALTDRFFLKTPKLWQAVPCHVAGE